MKIQIDDPDLKELIFTGSNNRYIKLARDKKFMAALGRVFRVLEIVENTNGLRLYSFLHYEQLKGIRKSSIRIMNGRIERLICEEIDDGIEIKLLEINRDHYGNKK